MGQQEDVPPTTYLAFGDLAVTVGGRRRQLTRRRERDALAVLLAHRAPVPADRLLAEVWGSRAALGSLQAVVSRLRSTLEPQRTVRAPSTCLVSTSAGYAIRAAADEVDVWLYEQLAERALAGSDPRAALALHERAESLWRGAPYGDADAPSVATARARLVELRASGAERAGRALLDLGEADRAVLVLTDNEVTHPFRERTSALLALALYRCGRQSEALATLRALRQRLAAELGVDPTPEVRHLEDEILHHSPGLDGRRDVTPPPVPDAPPPGDQTPGDQTPNGLALSGRTVSNPTRGGPLPRAGALRHTTATWEAAAGDVQSTLIGREEPLSRAQLLLDQLPLHPCRVLTVIGEPGVGKTSLVREILARADRGGLDTVVGQCHEGNVAPALWPWMHVVRTLCAGLGDIDPLLDPLITGSAEPADTGSGSLRLFDAVGRLLDALAWHRNGLVVVLEDIHWADATSLQLLTHLVERGSSAPLLLIATRRTTEGPGSQHLVDTLAALARAGAERIRLDGFSRAEVGEMLGVVLGDVPEPVVQLVDDATSGNPFFVSEYAQLLRSLGDLDVPQPLPVPDGVRDVIRQRVERLPAPGHLLLTAAAVLGADIEPADAAALAEVSLDDALDHLDLALAMGLLAERGQRYGFAHALTRETLYGGVSAARRIRLHARAAKLLANRLGSAPDAAADIAHHALLAAPLDEEHARFAFTWLDRAATVALARQAPVESRQLWLQARSVAESLGLDDERLHAMLGVARSAVRMGTFTEAPLLVTELAREANRQSRWDLVAAAAATFQLAGPWTWRIHGRKDEDLIDVLSAALPHVTGVDEAVLCGVLLIEHQFGWDTATSDAYAARAVRVAREDGDHQQLCSALLNRVIATAGRADLGPRSELAEELLAERPTGEIEVAGLFHLGFALHEEGRVAEAEETMNRASSKARRMTHSGLDVPLAWWRYAVARDHDEDAHRLGEEALAEHLRQRFYYGTELQTLHAVHSRLEGRRVPDAVIDETRDGLHAQRALVAWSLLETGDLDLAASIVGPAPPPHAVDYSIEASLCLRTLVAAALDRTAEVASLLQRLDAYRTPLAVYGSVDHLGAFDHFRAVAHRALGDLDTALSLARRAVVTNRRCDIRPWLRRSEALVAELELATSAPRKPGASPR